MSLSWPIAGSIGTQININLGTVQALPTGAYTILSLIKPKSTRGAVLAAKVSGTIRRELIIDTNSLYGEGDFVGFPGMVANDWHWIAQTKAAGSAPYLHYRKDITAGGSVVSATTAPNNHPDYASATGFALGQGDDESRDDHSLTAVWFRELSPSELNTIFGSLSVKPVLALAPDALWACNIPDPAALKDITGHGNNAISVAGPGSILAAAEPPGMDWATFFVDADMGSSETLDTNTVAVEFTVPAGTAYRFRSYYPAVAGTAPLFRLYNAAGTLLTSGSFDSAVNDTWNWFTPSAPIHLAAGTYRVAQFVSRYRFVSGFFSGGPITRSGVTANRGMFAGGTDAVPNTASTVWFGLDMEFVADSGGTDTFITDPVAGGGSTSGSPDGVALGTGGSSGSTGGTADGVALGSLPGGSGSGGQPDGLALGDLAGGGGTGGAPDGIALSTLSGGAGTGGQADTLTGDTYIQDPVQRGAGTGGQVDTVTSGSQVVHDQMVMPLAVKARTCLVTEVGKLANPPLKVQIRPGASFSALVDSTQDECCSGIAYVRTGNRVPTTGNWPTPLTDVDGPSASRGRAPFFAVNLELGIYRCLPTSSNIPDTNDDFPTEAQWLQAAQDQADDGAALLRVVCCLQDLYGNDSVIAGALTPLENQANCSGIIVNVQLRAPACDCVD